MTDPVPDDVRRFLDANVESVDQLEILRVLSEDPGRGRAVAELAAEIQAAPDAAAADVAALEARGLLTATGRGRDAVARHGGRTPALDGEVARLLAAYRERPVTMIRLVYARATERLRAFSDAFKLRKGD